MESRNLNRPSYVLALLLGFIAIVDAGNALVGMQTGEFCTAFSSAAVVGCGNSGWFIDLFTSGVSAALLALLLMRPHLYVFTAVVAWSFLAFGANFLMRQTPGLDSLATVRMTVHFVIFVVAGVLLIVEGQKWLEAERAKRPVAPAMAAMPVWTGAGWVVPYAPPPIQSTIQFGAPASSQPPFGSPWMPPAQTPPYGTPFAPQAAPQPAVAQEPLAAVAPVAPGDAAAPGATPVAPAPPAPAEPIGDAGSNK
jgi:hypothetical protein